MAATEYYTGGLPPPRPAVSQQPSHLGVPPPPGPQRASSHPNIQFSPPPQPQNPYTPPTPGAPPPYQQFSSSPPKPSVHFAPSPHPQYQRPSSSSGGRPTLQAYAAAPYAQNPYQPQGFQAQPQYQQPTAQPQPYAHNYSQPVYQNSGQQLQPYAPQRIPSYDSAIDQGYSSDPERHRRRHKKHHSRSRSRSRSRDNRPRRTSEASRSTNADGFIGAAGGGLIGDLIFPGLGTVGGALAGWLGGKKYGSQRKNREDRRDKVQYDWEERFHRPHHRRDLDLAYGDEKRDDHGRRRSYDDRDRKRYH